MRKRARQGGRELERERESESERERESQIEREKERERECVPAAVQECTGQRSTSFPDLHGKTTQWPLR